MWEKPRCAPPKEKIGAEKGSEKVPVDYEDPL
jgi:hypothetical protein